MGINWETFQEDVIAAKPAGFEFITLSPEEAAKFNEHTSAIRDNWVNNNADKGPSQEILDDAILLAQK